MMSMICFAITLWIIPARSDGLAAEVRSIVREQNVGTVEQVEKPPKKKKKKTPKKNETISGEVSAAEKEVSEATDNLIPGIEEVPENDRAKVETELLDGMPEDLLARDLAAIKLNMSHKQLLIQIMVQEAFGFIILFLLWLSCMRPKKRDPLSYNTICEASCCFTCMWYDMVVATGALSGPVAASVMVLLVGPRFLILFLMVKGQDTAVQILNLLHVLAILGIGYLRYRIRLSWIARAKRTTVAYDTTCGFISIWLVYSLAFPFGVMQDAFLTENLNADDGEGLAPPEPSEQTKEVNVNVTVKA